MSNYNKERRKQKGKKSKIMLFIMCVLYLIEIYVIYKKKKEKRINRGVVFLHKPFISAYWRSQTGYSKGDWTPSEDDKK